MTTTLRLIDGTTFEATECEWLRTEGDGRDPDIQVTGNFTHEIDPGNFAGNHPDAVSIYIPMQSVVWWQEPNQKRGS